MISELKKHLQVHNDKNKIQVRKLSLSLTPQASRRKVIYKHSDCAFCISKGHQIVVPPPLVTFALLVIWTTLSICSLIC